jgi:hypothetical protein
MGYNRFESTREHDRMMSELIAGACASVRIFEFALGRAYASRERGALLRAFLLGAPDRRISIIVHHDGELARTCPRLASLREQFGSRFTLRITLPGVRHVSDPFIIVDGRHYLHRFHYAQMRAASGVDDPVGAQQLLLRFGELWDASVPAPSGSVAGL